LLGHLLSWRSNQNLSWALGKASIEGEAERGLLIGRNNLTIKYMNWTNCQKKQSRRRSAVFKNADGSAGTWMLAQPGLVIWALLYLSIDGRSVGDIRLSVFQEKKNYHPALKTSLRGFLLL
jgi:hypothetical protein